MVLPISRSATTRIAAVCATLLLGGCSLFGVRTVEEAGYVVIDSSGDIELRDYAPMVVVETFVKADFDDAGNRAFGKLFAYISGENRAQQEIEMTAPVVASQDETGESIEMTAPVIADKGATGWRFAFVLPARYTLDSAPLPLRDDVRLRALEPRRIAVLTYSGLRSERKFEHNTTRLNDWLAGKGLEALSGPSYAGYDPPWTLPFLRRNEVMITVAR